MLASEILSIPVSSPERLFSNPENIDKTFRKLVKKWHPDVNSDEQATAVFSHLSSLKIEALKKVENGTWRKLGVVKIDSEDGRKFEVKYLVTRDFELGQIYYGKNTILWMLEASFNDLIPGFREIVSGLSYANDRMRDEMERYFPSVVAIHKCKDRRTAIVMRKTEDVFLLSDAQSACGGKFDPKHVAWILSGTYNIASYLEYANICHGAIAIDSLFISPKYHSMMLYGGWWYSSKVGEILRALPRLTHAIAPPSIIRDKRASPLLDTLSIKALGRSLLGDRTGMNLSGGGPDPMVHFLRSPADPSAQIEYKSWQKAVYDSFGARRFVELKISESDIYEKEQ